VRLEDGTPAWDAPVPIAPPAGRGFRHGHWYVLPLSTGEAATIDLVAGRLIARSRLPGEDVAGNFVAVDGRIVAQSATGMAAYNPLSELTRDYESRLTANPDDPRALARRGEMRLHLGMEQAALADLRRSLESGDAPGTRDLLAAALIEGLRTDFDAYRGAAGEIARIVRNPEQKALFHRLHAEGLQAAGEMEAAFGEYLKYSASLTAPPELERIDGRRSVRTDRRVRGQLTGLYAGADPAAQRRMADEVDRQIDQALQADDVAGLFRLLPLIPDPQRAGFARFELAQRLTGVDRLVELELLLLALRESGDEGRRAFAVGRLAELYFETNEPELLADVVDELSGPLADVPGLRGKTGRQLLAEWSSDPTRSDLFRREPVWPTAKVDVDDNARGASAAGGVITVRQAGVPSPVLRGWTWLTDPNGANLQAFNAYGTQKWQAPAGALGAMRGRRSSDTSQRVSAVGRILLFATDDQFMVVDAVSGRNQPVILASEQFQPQSQTLQPFIIINGRRPTLATGVVGPLTRDCLVFHAGTTLQAIDPLTGIRLWSHEVPEPSPPRLILADDEYVVVWPRTGDDVSIFSAIDGARIGGRKLLADEFPLRDEAAWGRRMIRYAASPGADGLAVRLALYDPVDDSNVWERTFAATADWRRTEGADLYVLHKDGTLRFIDGMTGTDQLVTHIPVEPAPERVTLLADRDRYFVATFHTPTETLQAADPLNRERPAVNGPVYAIDRTTGAVLWSQPVEQQQLVTGIPGDWPILPFATQLARPTSPDAARQAGRAVEIVLLDKGTGRILYHGEKSGQLDRLAWRSEPSVHRLTLFAGPGAVALQFAQAAAEGESPPKPEEK
jgi:outer membrane protein assembly factor BamB